MKTGGIILELLIFIAVGGLLSLFFPWYAYAVAFGILAYLMGMKKKAFIIGFLSGFILWLVGALWINQVNPSSLPEKMSSVLPLGGNVVILYLVTGLVGGLVGGLWTLAGSKLRRN